MKLVKVTVDIQNLKNEIGRLHGEAYQARFENDVEQRATIKRLTESLATLKARLEENENR